MLQLIYKKDSTACDDGAESVPYIDLLDHLDLGYQSIKIN